MIRWVGDGHTSPDIRADMCLRMNLALSERRGSMIVEGQRRRDTVARRMIIIGVRRGLWALSLLLGRRGVGGLMMTGLIMIIWSR